MLLTSGLTSLFRYSYTRPSQFLSAEKKLWKLNNNNQTFNKQKEKRETLKFCQKKKAMDFLKAEIARKKRLMEDKKLVGPDKKYFKRGDLMAQERQEYLDKHQPKKEALKELEELKELKKQQRGQKSELTASEEFPDLPRVEVIRRLRERNQPVLLFGETEEESCRRLRQTELDEPDVIEGIRNDFKDAMAKVDEVYLQEVLKSQGDDDDTDPDPNSSSAASSSTSSSSSSAAKRSKFDVPLTETDCTYEDLLDMVNDINKGDFALDLKLVAEFINVMLRKWAQELNERDEGTKMSVKGKIEAGVYAQTRTYLKPLLRMLKKQTVTDDIRDSLVKMIRYALQRDYILSNEAYMEMAIGNAPWPIGVTNAGIHARPARENIFSKHVAHVLNDETQRKYIQGLKRCLTKAQQYYSTDPSRSIDYMRKKTEQYEKKEEQEVAEEKQKKKCPELEHKS